MLQLDATTAVCPHFGVCGGCSLQDKSYADQLRVKDDFVRQSLSGLSIHQISPAIPSPRITFYRNKMEFSFGDQKDLSFLHHTPLPVDSMPVYLGLHPKRRFNLVTPTPDCFLLSQESQKIVRLIADWATDHRLETYIRTKNIGLLRHLVIREGKNTGERLVNLVSRSSLTHVDDLAARLRMSGLPITTFIWTLHDGLSDVARGDSQKIFWGDGSIKEKVGDILLRVPNGSFLQTNTHASEKMIELLRDWIGDRRQAVLFDLYCGVGTIGLNFTDRVRRVIGIELDASAVDEARMNAAANGRLNTEFMSGRAEDLCSILSSGHADTEKILIVDPPRAGLHPRVIDSILSSEIPLVCYVSCNPDTLGRDLRLLASKYTIEHVQPVDFFPHTDHVETAVKLQLR